MSIKIKSNRKHKHYNTKKSKKELSVKVLNQTQINNINNAKNTRDKAIMLLLLNTGLRVSELVDLNYNDVFENLKSKIFKDKMQITGKGNKTREIPLNNIAKKAILEIHNYNKKVLKIKDISNRKTLLLSKYGTRLTIQSIYNITMQIGANPHAFRHTFGTTLAKNKVRLEVIASILGHSSTDITNKYYIEKTIEDKIDAVNSVSLMPESSIKLVVDNNRKVM